MGELTWDLGDTDLDLMARAGLGALALALDTGGSKLAPLECDVQRTSVTLRWPDEVKDLDALLPLFEWAWQARGGGDDGLGVLYFPAIHLGSKADDVVARLHANNGVLSTFLQHPKVQPKTSPRKREVEIDGKRVPIQYVEPRSVLRPVADFKKRLFKRNKLVAGVVTFPSWLVPGATARHPHESSWQGTARQAIPLLLAPCVCFYLRVQRDYVIVAPDVTDLEDFILDRPLLSLRGTQPWAAGLGDAGLRVLVALRARQVARGLGTERELACQVIKVGEVAWNRQRVRNQALMLRPASEALERFDALDRHLGNAVRMRKDGSAGFVTIPSARGTIADNLVRETYWYCDLFEVPRELRKRVEEQRQSSESTQRAWFRLVGYHRGGLREFMQEMWKMGDSSTAVDEAFVSAFHEALRHLYGKEKEAAKRGSRSATERMQDRTEQVRRELSRANTRPLLRAVLAEFFAEAGRTVPLKDHRQAIWQFIDGARSWRRARDLALLSLATYKGRGSGDDETDNDAEPVSTD